MVILMECVLDLVVLDLFLVVDHLLQVYQLLVIVHQQVSGRGLAPKIFLYVLLSDGQNLSWLSRFSLLELLGYMGYFFIDFGWSELTLKKVWQSVFSWSLNVLVYNFLFNVYFGIQKWNSVFRYFIFKFNWWVFWV